MITVLYIVMTNTGLNKQYISLSFSSTLAPLAIPRLNTEIEKNLAAAGLEPTTS